MPDFGKIALSKLAALGVSISTFNLDVGLRKYRAAKAKLDAGLAVIVETVMVGDSITEGAYVSGGTYNDCLTKGYVGRTRAALAAKYGDVGPGFLPSTYPSVGSTKAWTYTGTWATASYGNAKQCYKSTTVGDTATITFPGVGIEFAVIQSPTVGQFQAYVDGAAAANFGATNAGGLITAKYSITGLADGTHTLTLKCSQASGIYVVGAKPITSNNKGIRVNNCCLGGTKTSDYQNTDNLQAAFDLWSPTLSVIALHTNDFAAQLPLATFTTQLQNLITRGKQFGDVLLLITGPRNVAGAIPQSSYVQIMKDLATANSCAYVSIWDRWGSDYNAVNSVGLYQDTVHPNDYGHADIANALTAVLLS